MMIDFNSPHQNDSIREMSNNAFDGVGLFLYPLKISGNQRFSDFFRGYRKRAGVWDGLDSSSLESHRISWLQKKQVAHLYTYSSHFVMLQKMLSSQSEMFYKIVVLENFANLTGNHLWWSLFSKMVGGSRQYCSCEFCEIFKSTFFIELLYFLIWDNRDCSQRKNAAKHL